VAPSQKPGYDSTIAGAALLRPGQAGGAASTRLPLRRRRLERSYGETLSSWKGEGPRALFVVLLRAPDAFSVTLGVLAATGRGDDPS
jgi:hypothetical protein